MYESRCGVCCDSCERKEAVHCSGCLNMEKPFWGGLCGVKACCEEKKLNHCGECTVQKVGGRREKLTGCSSSDA